MNASPTVSIQVLVYNHEPYLRQCLDGIVKQKTKFNFEAIVHDDASSDKSADIIRDYANKYPNIIKPIYETENQYINGYEHMGKILLPYIRGKYVAFCEGDDYWTDPNKLQQQVEIMESHPECYMCLHRVDSVQEDGSPINYPFPRNEMKTGIINSRQLVKLTWIFQTTCFMFRREVYELFRNQPLTIKKVLREFEDLKLYFFFANLGPAYYLNKSMSVHRDSSKGSWSLKQKEKSKTAKLKTFNEIIEFYKLYDEYTHKKYHDILDYRINIAKIKAQLAIGNRKGAFKGVKLKHSLYFISGSLKNRFKRIISK